MSFSSWLRQLVTDPKRATQDPQSPWWFALLGLAMLALAATALGFFTESGATFAKNLFLNWGVPTATSGLQLTDPVPDFIGREEEIRILTQALKDRRTAAIKAEGGVGKTQLAYYVARELRAEFSGGQVEVNMRGLDAQPTTPEQAMVEVVLTLEPAVELPESPSVLAALYRKLLAERAVLVLLENAKDSEQVRPLVPNPPSALLITSRQAIQLSGIQRVELYDLPEPLARKLLAGILGEKRATDAEIARLAELCGHRPLALRVAGNYLAANPTVAIHDYVSRVETKRGELRFQGRDVMAVLDDSVEALKPDTPELVVRWRSLAVFPAPFDRAAAEAVGEFEDGELDVLVGRSLVLYNTTDGRFRLHDLMRDLAREGLDYEDAYGAAQRHAGHYLTVAGRADDTYESGGEGVLEGLRLFDRERVHIEAGQAWAAEHATSDDRAAGLTQDYPLVASYVVDLRQHPRELIRWLEASAQAARKLGNKGDEGMALGNLGNRYLDLGETRRAIEHYEQHLAIARETGDRRGEGNALGNLGNAYADLGEPRRAIESYEQVLTIAGETGDRRGEGNALWNMSLALDKLGERAKAIEHARDALAIYEQIEDPYAATVRRQLEGWGGGRGRGRGSGIGAPRNFSAAPPGLESMMACVPTVETVGYYPSAPPGRKAR